MKNYFKKIAEYMIGQLKADEVLLLDYTGEESDFCRFNHNKIRQVGSVSTSEICVKLINQQKQAIMTLNLSRDWDSDHQTMDKVLDDLREINAVLPEDKHLLYSTEIKNSEYTEEKQLIPTNQMVEQIIEYSAGLDLVGILASGGIFKGFANSIGQFNWFETYNYNFDWSCYLHSDKAIKQGASGSIWNTDEIKNKLDKTREHLEILKRDPITIKPGNYNTYISPDAFMELCGLLSHGSFSEKSRRIKQSPLLKLSEGTESFHSSIEMTEDRSRGMSPNFDSYGFNLPKEVALVENGKFVGNLISPRTAKEFDLTSNAGDESISSMYVAPGKILETDILKTIGTGLYINNLWYTNYSDQLAGKISGMTRFACFWVENGEIVAPINVMRFDESIYNILGHKLIGMTNKSEMIADPSTYFKRSTNCFTLPGVFVKGMTFSS